MINGIVRGISRALYEEFGDGFTIYGENVEQGLKTPSFFILCIGPANRLFLGRRYFRPHRFCIHYFPPKGAGIRYDTAQVLERLYLCLEYITANGDLIRGNQMEGIVNDEVLQFFINYDLFVHKKAEAEKMGDVEHRTKLKG